MPTAEQMLEQGKASSANAVKTTVSDISSTISDQVGISNETNSQTQPKTTQQSEPSNNMQQENQRTNEVVSDFYSPSNDQAAALSQQGPTDDQRLADVRQKLRQELHNEVYYQNLISYEQKKPEERPADKMERQQMEELQLKQEKQQQDLPIAVKMAQTHTETSPGIAG